MKWKRLQQQQNFKSLKQPKQISQIPWIKKPFILSYIPLQRVCLACFLTQNKLKKGKEERKKRKRRHRAKFGSGDTWMGI